MSIRFSKRFSRPTGHQKTTSFQARGVGIGSSTTTSSPRVVYTDGAGELAGWYRSGHAIERTSKVKDAKGREPWDRCVSNGAGTGWWWITIITG